MSENTALDERMKRYEHTFRRYVPRRAYTLMRLDGRAFHSFTRSLRRPYDPVLSQMMFDTALWLAQESNAAMTYTQSDEITLAWFETSQSPSDYAFDGRFQKLASVLAGMASAKFGQLVREHLPQKAA